MSSQASKVSSTTKTSKSELKTSNRIPKEPSKTPVLSSKPQNHKTVNKPKPELITSKKVGSSSTVNTTATKPISIKRTTSNQNVDSKKLVSNVQTKVARQPLLATKRIPVKSLYEPKATIPPKAPLSQKNVMNTIHNVTVLSPPRVRKELPVSHDVIETNIEPSTSQYQSRERTRTRTLESDEILVLNTTSVEDPPSILPASLPIKESVSYEIHFDNHDPSMLGRNSKNIANVNSKQVDNVTKVSVETIPVKTDSLKPTPDIKTPAISSDEGSDVDYEDDFDSYESDFESCTHSSASSLSNRSVNPMKSQAVHNGDSSGTRDQDFDSGMFDVKVHSTDTLTERRPDTTVHLEDDETQIDSGFGYSAVSPTPKPKSDQQVTPRPANNYINKRSMDLMSKISMDTMSYSLFELKPIPYEYYMKMFGHVNATQMSTQTGNNSSEQDCQTEARSHVSIWTQWPPHLKVKNMHTPWYFEDALGCGTNSDSDRLTEHQIQEPSTIDWSLDEIHKLDTDSRMVTRIAPKTIAPGFDQLNWFLQKASITISSIINEDKEHTLIRPNGTDHVSDGDGYYTLNWNSNRELRDKQIISIFTSHVQANMIYSVHQSDGEIEDCLLAMWNIPEVEEPLYVMSCWSRVVCVEVMPSRLDVVIAGLKDGSIAVWNLKTQFGSNTGMGFTIIPCHVIEPTFESRDKTFDYGSVMAIKNIDAAQICSINEGGLLTTWSLINSSELHLVPKTDKYKHIDHSSPWSTVKLVQNYSFDLRAQYNTNPSVARSPLRPGSAFDQTRSYFESNIFSDAALQELHRINFPAQPGKNTSRDSLHFKCLDLAIMNHSFFVATNQNFLLTGARSLYRNAKVHSVRLSDSRFVHATQLSVMTGREALLVGMSDGSVKILWCDTRCEQPEWSVEEQPNAVAEDQWNFNAKSCAIQNIIKDERRESQDQTDGAGFELSVNDELDDTLRYWNQVTLMHGQSVLHSQVDWVHYSAGQNRMLVLSGQLMRQFNFDVMSEESDAVSDKIQSAAVYRGDIHENLALLMNNEIRIFVHRRTS